MIQYFKEMNSQKDVQKFKQKFAQFVKPHKCQEHNKNLNIVCIDSSCQHKGLICSICLTINGPHKNHDAVDVNQYIQNCFKQMGKQKSGDQATDLLARAQTVFDNLLTILSAFIDNCTHIIKTYISQRSQLHQLKVRGISNQTFIKKLLQTKLQSLPQVNKLLKSLSSKYSIHQISKPLISQNKSLTKAHEYVNDISYQQQFIGRELRKLQVRLKSILVTKQTSPVVLHYQPSFYRPSLLQNGEVVYIGETKENKPNGKGICFHHDAGKVIYGEFISGKVNGTAQLYYQTGDYYIGEFKNDKKCGRGVYRWNGKEYNVYEGQFKGGRRHGKGTFWWADGSKYVGEFSEGQQAGFGVLYRNHQDKEYEGFWVNGEFSGKGIQYFANGEKFQGSFKNDKFDGDGILYKQNQVIHGTWVQNQLVSIRKSEK